MKLRFPEFKEQVTNSDTSHSFIAQDNFMHDILPLFRMFYPLSLSQNYAQNRKPLHNKNFWKDKLDFSIKDVEIVTFYMSKFNLITPSLHKMIKHTLKIL